MKKLGGKLLPKQVKERLNVLKSDRKNWEWMWQQVADYFVPDRDDVTTERSPGERRNVQLLDSTGVQANELLAGAIHGQCANPSTMFFGLTTGDDEIDMLDGVRTYLQRSTRTLLNILNNSNFQTEAHQFFIDMSSIGTAPFSVEEDDEFVVRFGSRHIREIFVSENNKGIVDEVYRSFKWNVRQIIGEFGEDVLKKSPTLQRAAEKNLDTKFDMIHAIYPRTLANSKATDNRRYISQYVVCVEKETELSLGYFRDLPLLVPRWSKASGEVYGRSPAMKALSDAKTLNKMTETTMRGAQKTVDPPLQMPDDSFVGTIDLRPAGLNYYRSGTNDRIEPIFNDARIDFGFEAMRDRRQRIREAFYVDQLRLGSGPQMTATETVQRTEENMRFLGPILGRLQSEWLRPMIARVFDIAQRKGLLEEPPEVLRDRQLDVVYSSMIAKAQRVNDMNSVNQTMAAISPFVTIDQNVMDNFNLDNAVRGTAKGFGLPQEYLRDTADRDEIRESRQQAQAAAIQQQQAQQETETAIKAAPAMAKLEESAA